MFKLRHCQFLPILPAALFLVLTGCSDSTPEASGKLRVAAGIPPVAGLVAAIGGDSVEVTTLLPEGRSPHDYSPVPGTIRAAALSKIYFDSGLPFEAKAVKPLGSTVRIIDVTAGVHRIPFSADSCSEAEPHDHDHDHDHTGMDPHVWLSLPNLAVMARNIAAALSEADPGHAAAYRERLDAVEADIAAAAKHAADTLMAYRGRSFYVYHPAFGYYADMTGLRQIAVELGGREPQPARLADVIRRARKDKVRVIFVQKQFNPASATALSKAIGGRVEELDPLAGDAVANIEKITTALAAEFAGQQ